MKQLSFRSVNVGTIHVSNCVKSVDYLEHYVLLRMYVELI